MRVLATGFLLLGYLGSCLAYGQISNFQHIIVIVQENRSPDNLFNALCIPPYGSSSSCSTKPKGSQYNIQTSNWVDKTSTTGVSQPFSGPLANAYDLGHGHVGFANVCDLNQAKTACLMDGAANNSCSGTCPARAALAYVDNSTGTLDPYLDMVTQYGWANYMFQTNQGPSFPAHQYLFGGTSAPSASDDAAGVFDAENPVPEKAIAGCIALSTTSIELIKPKGEGGKVYPCFEHQTMADLLDAIGVTWKYYTTGPSSILTAPNAINHICQPNMPYGGACTGPDWVSDVVFSPSQVLTDISKCKLAGVSWVTPNGPESDHPRSNTGLGPGWVASIVNAVGNNAKCSDGEVYWDNTAILITWDDWGGWYDHEPPTILAGAQGDYQYGLRVPFIVVSAYTTAGHVDNNRNDFGSILRFIEQNFGIGEGSLNFADSRSTTDLTGFFNLNQAARVFTTIPARVDANYFINDKTPLTDADDY